LGLNKDSAQFYCDKVGLPDMQALGQQGMKDLISLHTSTIPRMSTTGSIIFPQNILRKITVVRYWIDFRKARGQTYTATECLKDMDFDDWFEWFQELEARESIKDEPPTVGKLETTGEWEAWNELFRAHISMLSSPPTGVSLAYVIRPKDQTAVGKDDLTAEYGSIEEELIRTMRLNTKEAKRDKERVWNVLKPAIQSGLGTYYAHIRPFEKTKDGRAAYLALCDFFETAASTNSQLQQATTDIQITRFTGYGRFTFEQYIHKFINAYTTLEKCGEGYTERRKVTEFLDGITDPRLATAKSTAKASSSHKNSFEACYQFMAGEFATIKSSLAENRRAGALSGGRGGRGYSPGRVVGRGRGGRGTPWNLPKEKWDLLTPQQKKEHMEKRKAHREALRIGSGKRQKFVAQPGSRAVAAMGTGGQTSDEVAWTQPAAGSSTEKVDEPVPDEDDRKPAAKPSQSFVRPGSRWNIAPKALVPIPTKEPERPPLDSMDGDDDKDYDSGDDPNGPHRMRGPDGVLARDHMGNVIYHDRPGKADKEKAKSASAQFGSGSVKMSKSPDEPSMGKSDVGKPPGMGKKKGA
jgi:hypothetical protein